MPRETVIRDPSTKGQTTASPERIQEQVVRIREALNRSFPKGRQQALQLAQSPEGKERLLNITRTFLGAIPGFQNLARDDANRIATFALNQALQPTTGERVQGTLEETLPAVGGTVGLLAPGGGMVSGAGGLTGGELIAETARPLTTGEAPDYMAALKRAAMGSALLAGGEAAVMRPGGAVLDKTVGKMRRDLMAGPLAESETTKAARRTLEPFMQRTTVGGRQAPAGAFTPVQLGGELTPGGSVLIENIAESGMLGAGVMRTEVRAPVQDAVERLAIATQEALEQGFSTNEEVTKLMLNGLRGQEMLVRAVSRRRHAVVDELDALAKAAKKQQTGLSTMVNTKSTIQMTGFRDEPVTKAVFSNFKVPEVRDKTTGRIVARGYQGADGFFEMMNSAGPRQMNFRDTDRARTALLQIQRDFSSPTASGPEKAIARTAGDMAKALERSMDVAAQRLDPKAFQAYKAAKEFHKERVVGIYEDALLVATVKALQKEPSKLGSYLAHKDVVDKLDVIKRGLGEAGRETQPGGVDIWPAIQGRVLSTLTTNSVREESIGVGLELKQLVDRGLIKEVSGKRLLEQVQNLSPESRRTLLEGKVGEMFRHFANAVEVGARKPEGPGKVGTILMQFGAITTVAGAGITLIGGGEWAAVGNSTTGAGVAIMLTPRALAAIYRNPERLKNIADGIIGGPKSKAFSRLLLSVAATNRELQQEVGGSLQEIGMRAQRALPNAAPLAGGRAESIQRPPTTPRSIPTAIE